MPANLLDRTIVCLEDRIKAVEAENSALKALEAAESGALEADEATDPLCRGLTPAEQQWLGQTSLISLCAKLSPSLSLKMTAKILRASIEATRCTNPYLNVGIDRSRLSFKRVPEIPLTIETSEDRTGKAARSSVQRELKVGVNRETCLARVHLLRSATESSYLIVLGDHLCFDGKSLIYG